MLKTQTKTLKKSIIPNKHNTKKARLSDYSLWLYKGYPYANQFINPQILIHKIRNYKTKISFERFDYLYKKELPQLKEYRQVWYLVPY